MANIINFGPQEVVARQHVYAIRPPTFWARKNNIRKGSLVRLEMDVEGRLIIYAEEPPENK